MLGVILRLQFACIRLVSRELISHVAGASTTTTTTTSSSGSFLYARAWLTREALVWEDKLSPTILVNLTESTSTSTGTSVRMRVRARVGESAAGRTRAGGAVSRIRVSLLLQCLAKEAGERA